RRFGAGAERVLACDLLAERGLHAREPRVGPGLAGRATAARSGGDSFVGAAGTRGIVQLLFDAHRAPGDARTELRGGGRAGQRRRALCDRRPELAARRPAVPPAGRARRGGAAPPGARARLTLAFR